MPNDETPAQKKLSDFFPKETPEEEAQRLKDREFSARYHQLKREGPHFISARRISERIYEALLKGFRTDDLIAREKAISDYISAVAHRAHDLPGGFHTLNQSIAETVEKLSPTLRGELLSWLTEAAPEDAKILAETLNSGLEEPMKIAVEQNRVARNHRPDREGKKLVAGHFDVDTAEKIKDLARARRTTVQAVLEEAIADLFVKYEREVSTLDQVMKGLNKG